MGNVIIYIISLFLIITKFSFASVRDLNIEYFETLCQKKDFKSCATLSSIYINRNEFKKAYKYAKKSCKKDIGLGCYNLGFLFELLYKHNLLKNFNYSLEFYKKACKLDFAEGCNKLGFLFKEGTFVEKNYRKAVNYFFKSCKLNNATGCNELGILYRNGLGVEKNEVLAFDLFRKACNLNKTSSCFTFIRWYEWYKKACDMNNPSGCYYLASFYKEGFHLPKNEVIAYLFYKKACKLNYRKACNELNSFNYDEKKILDHYKAPKGQLIDIKIINRNYADLLIKIFNTGTGIGNIQITVNGILVKEINLQEIEGLEGNYPYYLLKLRIPLIDKANNIEIFIFDENNLIRSRPIKYKIHFKKI